MDKISLEYRPLEDVILLFQYFEDGTPSTDSCLASSYPAPESGVSAIPFSWSPSAPVNSRSLPPAAAVECADVGRDRRWRRAPDAAPATEPRGSPFSTSSVNMSLN